MDEAREQFALHQYLAHAAEQPVSCVCGETEIVDDAVCAALKWSHTSGITPVSEEVEEEAGAVALTAKQGSSELKVILKRSRMNQMDTQLRLM